MTPAPMAEETRADDKFTPEELARSVREAARAWAAIAAAVRAAVNAAPGAAK